MSDARDYVVRKGGFFYRPLAAGYCSDILEAGRWDHDSALAHQKGVEGVTVHRFSDYWPPKSVFVNDLVKALKLARARIEYLGAACNDPRHFEANANTFLPAIDEVLSAVGSRQTPVDK